MPRQCFHSHCIVLLSELLVILNIVSATEALATLVEVNRSGALLVKLSH